jgi:hypothetical protein
MGPFLRLFLPLAAILAAGAAWLQIEYGRDPIFAIVPPQGPGGAEHLAPGLGAPPGSEAQKNADDLRQDSRPRIAIIVTGLGLDRALAAKVIAETPPEVTLAFTPYADDGPALIEQARARGHEVLVAVPLEPSDVRRRDAGPLALSVAEPEATTRRRLAAMLARMQGSLGVIGDLGDRFARDPVAMRPIFEELAARRLFYVDNRLESGEVVTPETGVPVAAVAIWLDRDLTAAGIDGALAATEALGRRDGAVVAVARPYPLTLERLRAWLDTLDRRALRAAPISAVVRRGS